MSESPVTVQIDDRIRLLSAVLAMTTWPEQEQDRYPHGVHAHAKATREYLAEDEYHPAVLAMQELMESGLSLDAIFSYAACLNWPGLRARGGVPEWAPRQWAAQLRDFMHRTRLRDFWEQEASVWEQAAEQARRALTGGDPLGLLSRFFGPLNAGMVFQPNLCYPSSQAIGFRWGKRLVAICPPRVAWGNNPPWPYDDAPAETYQEAFGVYTRVLLHEHLEQHPEETEQARRVKLPVPNTFRALYPEWFDQFAVLFISGVTALFLEQTFGKPEADAYIMMAHKAHRFEVLPSVVEVLRRYLEDQARGKYSVFAEYMPTFCTGLRVTEKLKKL